MATILDGKALSEQIKTELKVKTQELFEKKGIRPGLALLIAGNDPASTVYVNNKEKTCKELGYNSLVVRLPEDVSEDEVLKYVNEWNNNPEFHGILVQSPLPKHIDESRVLMAINPSKDVDGFHPESIGRLVLGLNGFVSCTPAGIMEMIKRYDIETSGKHVVVLGRSNIVGKPIANLLYQKNKSANAIVTICHTGAEDFSVYTRQADILIAAVGVPKLIKAKHLKDGVVVIDVGINRIEDNTTKSGTRLVGDVDFADVVPIASAISPVPGGVGLMTIAMLMMNTFQAAELSIGLAV